MKKIGILTSGGDAPGMNAAIRAVVRCGIEEGFEVYGIERGYEGLIEGEIRQMYRSSVGDILHRGGTMLKTARSERFKTPEGQKMALNMLQSFGIEGLVVIGGDGSMKGGLVLDKFGIPIMSIPGTIDNDLGYTDYTIGFDTAVNTVLSAISNIRDTSSSHERTTVIEVMGRNCGDIALYSAICGGAENVLIPEAEFDVNAICRKIIQGRNRGKLHNIIIKAEGVDIPSEELVSTISERTGQSVKLVVLAYLQRGGSPTARDRLIAALMAERAVKLLVEESNSKAIGIVGDKIVDYDLAEALKINNEVDYRLLKITDVLSK